MRFRELGRWSLVSCLWCTGLIIAAKQVGCAIDTFGVLNGSATAGSSETQTNTSSTGVTETGGTTDSALCGNGEIEGEEACDDGNSKPYDGCEPNCEATPKGVISAGGGHTCALLGDGALRCWGGSLSGRLGYGNLEHVGDDEPASTVGPVSLGGQAIAVATGSAISCALLEGGDVRCWGDGTLLGYGTLNDIGDDELPSSVGPVSLGGPAVQISSGSTHTCALMDSGDVRCWGNGNSGKLGIGGTGVLGDNELPSEREAVSLGGPASMVTAGYSHTCAILVDGSLRCWGSAC